MTEESKTSKAQQKAVNKYVKNNYDRVNVTFPKGHKAEIKPHAEAQSESVNAFIVRAVNEAMERESSTLKPTTTSSTSAQAATDTQEKTSLNALNCAALKRDAAFFSLLIVPS